MSLNEFLDDLGKTVQNSKRFGPNCPNLHFFFFFLLSVPFFIYINIINYIMILFCLGLGAAGLIFVYGDAILRSQQFGLENAKRGVLSLAHALSPEALQGFKPNLQP
jgi:hypothetical protein